MAAVLKFGRSAPEPPPEPAVSPLVELERAKARFDALLAETPPGRQWAAHVIALIAALAAHRRAVADLGDRLGIVTADPRLERAVLGHPTLGTYVAGSFVADALAELRRQVDAVEGFLRRTPVGVACGAEMLRLRTLRARLETLEAAGDWHRVELAASVHAEFPAAVPPEPTALQVAARAELAGIAAERERARQDFTRWLCRVPKADPDANQAAAAAAMLEQGMAHVRADMDRQRRRDELFAVLGTQPPPPDTGMARAIGHAVDGRNWRPMLSAADGETRARLAELEALAK